MISWMGSPISSSRSFLFLDRDGVINVNRKDYIKRWEEFQFFPDTLEALRWLKEREIQVILVSNQSALNRGYMTWEDFWDIHHRMIASIRRAGGDLLGAFYCPHRPDENCSCRKPAPDMILSAARIHSIPLERTCFIGDSPSDIMTAAATGCRGVLLDRFSEEKNSPDERHSGTELPPRYFTLLKAVGNLFQDTVA